jgi:peptidoglycan/LPS O-acetylase OafA/YrhL
MSLISDAIPTEHNPLPPNRFLSLDAARGLAALGIVFYHWSHFSQAMDSSLVANPNDQPFYRTFKLFYDHGFFAVELFFCLSGFVFFWLYAQKIANHEIGQEDFCIRRFARLYPLHLLTLIAVLGLQTIFYTKVGHYFVYPNNDLYHFVLNLFLASSWGLQQGASFNGVSWSISVEVFLYLTFFFSCRLFGAKLQAILFWVVLGICLRGVNPPIGQGISSFYMGGFTYWLYQKINYLPFSRKSFLAYILATVTSVTWVAIILENQYGLLNALISSNLSTSSGLLGKVYTALTVLVIFPTTLLTLTLFDQALSPVAKHLAFLGDISYSVYLLHFPLQLSLVLGVQTYGIDRQIFYRPAFQIGFFILIITIAHFSYNHLEMPLQRSMRKRFIPVI